MPNSLGVSLDMRMRKYTVLNYNIPRKISLRYKTSKLSDARETSTKTRNYNSVTMGI